MFLIFYFLEYFLLLFYFVIFIFNKSEKNFFGIIFNLKGRIFLSFLQFNFKNKRELIFQRKIALVWNEWVWD